jgi:hypothetical protein
MAIHPNQVQFYPNLLYSCSNLFLLQKDLVLVLNNGKVQILDQNLSLVGAELKVFDNEEATVLSFAFDPSGKFCAFTNMKGIDRNLS